ncbi:DUF4381 domain-containing protein [Labrys okinawensis]|uniref:DUF4381 domain-containing protein n=1 Tax=Labrys okinawensis TaxID=346911 RepID=UPI0039BD6546
MNDPGDLSRLHDIAAPSGFPFWPLAPGMWILIAALAAILLLQAWRTWLRYRANAYRRIALRELDAVAAPAEGGGADDVLRVSAILKRVALVSYPREQVASLSGKAWAGFIAAQSRPGIDVAAITSALEGAFAAKEAGTSVHSLVAAARAWVRLHQAAEGQ